MMRNSNLQSGFGVWGLGFGQDAQACKCGFCKPDLNPNYALGDVISKNCPLGRADLEKGWVGKQSRPVKLCLTPRPSGEFLDCRFFNLHSNYALGDVISKNCPLGRAALEKGWVGKQHIHAAQIHAESRPVKLCLTPRPGGEFLNPIPHSPASKFGCRKSGFGILEVLIAAVVLGFLVVGLTQLQLGNREAILRIRTRDAAQIVAQQFLDSLSSVGINSIESGYEDYKKDYEWMGKANQKTKITYTINAKVESDETMKSEERSNFTDANSSDAVHIRAKKIDLTVSWPFKGGEQQINLSRIVK